LPALKNTDTLNNILEITPRLTSNVRVVITTHHKPDADALGSSLGLFHFLKKLNVDATVISPTDYGDFLEWLPGEEQVINFEENEAISAQLIANADLVFCLDFNALKRVNKMGELIAQAPAIKVMIDHHLEPEGFAQFGLHTTLASSTCELVFTYIEMMDKVELVDEVIATCLYSGIMTDTASFKHSSTYPSTHRVAAVLLEKGAKPHKIYEAVYDNYSLDRTRFIGYCINDKLQYLPQYNTVLITITTEELKRFNSSTGDTEGLVNWGLTIKGVKLSVLIVDRTVLRKMSFRSKGDFPANEFARKYFNGGGHFSAAGGESTDSLVDTEARFKEALDEYKQFLT
jgi:phosphoesterase RecJ-like protein